MKLPRTLEPEVMDEPAEAMAYDEMDHTEVNRRFVDDYLAFDDAPTDVLDLGTGTARIPIQLCGRREGVRVFASDFSPAMLDTAKVNVELAGFSDRIVLDLQDSKSLSFEDGYFPSVISNSLIHHLPDPSKALLEAVRVVAPDGCLFIRDLMRPGSAERVDELVETYAGSEGQAARAMFWASLHAALTLDEVRDLVRALGFAADTVVATSDRHWTWAARAVDRA